MSAAVQTLLTPRGRAWRYPTLVIIETAAAPPFLKNGFVVACERTAEAVIIDPGDEVEHLLRFIDDRKLSVQSILLTHAHVDHVDVFVHHTPGHCPGGVCLQIGRRGEMGLDLFVGDTLFAGSIGRTDLPGGNYETLLRSIRQVLFGFGDDARVYPGHGPDTTIGQEKRTNPFLRDPA